MALVRNYAGSLRWLMPLKDRGTLGVEDCLDIVETRVSNVMPGKRMDRYPSKKLITRRFLSGLNIASKCTSSSPASRVLIRSKASVARSRGEYHCVNMMSPQISQLTLS